MKPAQVILSLAENITTLNTITLDILSKCIKIRRLIYNSRLRRSTIIINY